MQSKIQIKGAWWEGFLVSMGNGFAIQKDWFCDCLYSVGEIVRMNSQLLDALDVSLAEKLWVFCIRML